MASRAPRSSTFRGRFESEGCCALRPTVPGISRRATADLGDTRGDTIVSPRRGSGWPRAKMQRRRSARGSTHSACPLALKTSISRHFECRRRDSNPRHADYDSAALWLYRAVCNVWGTEKGTCVPQHCVPMSSWSGPCTPAVSLSRVLGATSVYMHRRGLRPRLESERRPVRLHQEVRLRVLRRTDPSRRGCLTARSG